MNDSLINKIRNLLKMTTSNGCTEAEAAAAAAKVQELMIAHNISISQVKVSERSEPAENVDRAAVRKGGKLVRWKIALLDGCAQANFCKCYSRHYCGDVEMIVVGKPTNRAACMEVFEYLEATIERLAARAIKQRPSYESARSYGNAFRYGAAERLRARLKESIRQASEKGAAGSTAIVVADVYKAAFAEIERYYQQNNVRLSRGRGASVKSGSGYHAGSAAAANVSLTPSKRIGRSSGSAPALGR
jgi:hypothetical protein